MEQLVVQSPRPSSPSSSASSTGSSRELQCVGTMEIVKPKAVGFLCGSIPVPTDSSFHAFNSDLVPSRQTVSAPRYRMLPTETDLNRPPLTSHISEKALPIAAVQSKTNGDASWEANTLTSTLSRKLEALAVSGLVEYGDELDVIAPTDVLKQIFKIPYSKARLSIAVQRVGQTLVLDTGPDVEEGEELVRRHKNQSKCADQSLFLNFAMHSVRMEACDCPPTHRPQSEGQSSSSVLPGRDTSHLVGQNDNIASRDDFNHRTEFMQRKQDNSLWENKNKRSKGRDPVQNVSHVGEKPKSSMQESDRQRRVGNNGFLQVLLWQFHDYHMLLGSDLLLFSNEKYVAVSLHLWDVTRQATPLTWLEAWLDNVMASVPEMAICYHQNGVVQGYELLKTDEIFLLKGISEDGIPAFNPHIVQQNGLSVFRFLENNCTQDPGAYWLYKSAGEDVIQLFDLSAIPKNHSSGGCDDSSVALPSIIHGGRSDSLFSLGTLLYRIGHRLSLSMSPNDRAKCVRFFRKCLDFLDEPNHLVIRAFAHEQFARLILNHEEELDLTSESFPVECKVMVTDAEEESLDQFSCFTESIDDEKGSSLVSKDNLIESQITFPDIPSEVSIKMTLEANLLRPEAMMVSEYQEAMDTERALVNSSDDKSFAVCSVSGAPAQVAQTVTDPISSKLAAIHHVSQAIQSFRWVRQLQISEPVSVEQNSPSSVNFLICACGDPDCIEVCDIREWLPTTKLDHKLWKLVLLLGESYLALGEAYKEAGQLDQALKTVELACSVYGSMPQKLDDARFISSIVSPQSRLNRSDEAKSCVVDLKEVKSSPSKLTLEDFSSTYLFWAKAWMLVGDVYVEYHVLTGKEISKQPQRKPLARNLKMSSEVVKEVKRLKKKLTFYNQNCSLCSLVNCSCQSDRASSGSSASSSNGNGHAVGYNRKQNKRSQSKSACNTLLDDRQDECASDNMEIGQNIDGKVRNTVSVKTSQTEITLKDTSKVKNGGIFKYLGGPLIGDAESTLLSAQSCYEEARKALIGLPTALTVSQSIAKKRGWICNELGRNRLERKELNKAEDAFAEAIHAFREVSDYTNVVLINCNLGHGRRALAEELLPKIEGLKTHNIFRNTYKQALETAKLEYRKSLKYYMAAKSELNAVMEEADSVPNSLSNEVCTQLAHTYLRFGMLLAREDKGGRVYEHGSLEDTLVPGDMRARKELRKNDISANDAIREALTLYESLGDLRKQEAAYAYFQLACYHRDCSLIFLESDHQANSPKGESYILQRVKQYASLADRNWQKALDFYGPNTHPTMYLTILMERSTLSFSLSSSLHTNAMLESAITTLLEGRYISDKVADSMKSDSPELHAKFWSQLQMVLRKMLAIAVPSANANKSSLMSQTSNKSGDVGKLRELYKMALKSTGLTALTPMHTLWTCKCNQDPVP